MHPHPDRVTAMSDDPHAYNAATRFKPGNPGRTHGRLGRLTILHREFCRGIIESPEYRTSLVERIMEHTLPAAVEVMLHWYAYGKPHDQKDNSMALAREELSGLTTEELYVRAQNAARDLLNLKEQQDQQEQYRVNNLHLFPPPVEPAPTEDGICLDTDSEAQVCSTCAPAINADKHGEISASGHSTATTPPGTRVIYD
jgi:hypothetical protein